MNVQSNVRPVYPKLWHLPFSVRKAVFHEIKTLLEHDVIEKVMNLNGYLLLGFDLCEPNKAVVIYRHPFPHIEEISSKFKGATFFPGSSKCIKFCRNKKSTGLAEFITHESLFCFKCKPYGLASVPSCFQRQVFSVLSNVLYLVHSAI